MSLARNTHGPFLGGGRRDIQMNRLTARPPVPLFTLGLNRLLAPPSQDIQPRLGFIFSQATWGDFFFSKKIKKIPFRLIRITSESEQRSLCN